jgi:heme-degrading monooxygenase HmoA
MYARVTHFQGSPERVDEGIQAFQKHATPAVQRQPGFQGAYVLIDRASGKGLAISFWDTEAALMASEAAVRAVREQSLQAFGGTATPTTERYDVAVQAAGPARSADTGGARLVARVTVGQAPLEQTETLIRLYREQVVPLAHRQAGFHHAYLLTDRQRGKALAISLWQSREALQQNEAALNQARDQLQAQTGQPSPPTTDVYEVALLRSLLAVGF